MSAFRFSKRGTVTFLEATPLARCASLVHAFCTRQGGLSGEDYSSLNFSIRQGDSSENVQGNWGRLAASFGLSLRQFVVMNQQHGDGIVTLRGAGGKVDPHQPFPSEDTWQCDALITDRPGTALVVKTADCVPLLFLDPVRRVIAAAHAGWRGSALNIAGKVVDALREQLSSRAEDIAVAIGPAIGPCCYEVDAPVWDALPGYREDAALLQPCPEGNRWMLDLARVNCRQLEERGVLPGNIVSARHCTCCRGDFFFSHRRDGVKTGRHVNFIMLGEAGGRETTSRYSHLR